MARILIVSDSDSNTERLKTAFREAGLGSESTNSMAAGCNLAKSGRFQAIFSTPDELVVGRQLIPDNICPLRLGKLRDLAHELGFGLGQYRLDAIHSRFTVSCSNMRHILSSNQLPVSLGGFLWYDRAAGLARARQAAL